YSCHAPSLSARSSQVLSFSPNGEWLIPCLLGPGPWPPARREPAAAYRGRERDVILSCLHVLRAPSRSRHSSSLQPHASTTRRVDPSAAGRWRPPDAAVSAPTRRS